MTEHTLYVATGNAGKLRDFAVAAAQVSAGWTIAALPGLDTIEAPPEDGATFHENAAAKALYYAHYAPGMLVLADDSGLEVEALAGAPGVFSARYAEQLGFAPVPSVSGDTQMTKDARNNACLLAELTREQAAEPWLAGFRCALAVARDNQVITAAEGTVAGQIQREARGTGGFGYDALFLLPQRGQTMAELTPEMRLSQSHRGAALRRLLPQLAALLG